jgi:hypothetical protein
MHRDKGAKEIEICISVDEKHYVEITFTWNPQENTKTGRNKIN